MSYKAPSKWACEWLRWGALGGVWEKVVTLYRGSAPCLGAETVGLLKLGPIRREAPGWHGNYSTLSLPQSAGGDGKASP